MKNERNEREVNISTTMWIQPAAKKKLYANK